VNERIIATSLEKPLLVSIAPPLSYQVHQYILCMTDCIINLVCIQPITLWVFMGSLGYFLHALKSGEGSHINLCSLLGGANSIYTLKHIFSLMALKYQKNNDYVEVYQKMQAEMAYVHAIRGFDTCFENVAN
jgi:hypothetical protein